MYILASETTGRCYIGCAECVGTRVAEHNAGKVTSTRGRGPWTVVYTEECEDRVAATRREREIKSKKSRGWIEYHLLKRRNEGL